MSSGSMSTLRTYFKGVQRVDAAISAVILTTSGRLQSWLIELSAACCESSLNSPATLHT